MREAAVFAGYWGREWCPFIQFISGKSATKKKSVLPRKHYTEGRIQNMDPGPWTAPVDPVHGPPHGPGPWTTSVDPVHGPPPAEPVFHCIHVHGNRQTQTMDPGLWTTL